MLRCLLALPVLASAARISDSSLGVVDPLQTAVGMLSLTLNSTCTLTEWKGSYSFNGYMDAATIDVGPFQSTFRIGKALGFALAGLGLSGLDGVHGNQEVAFKFCQQRARVAFPNACEFFKPGGLLGRCPVLGGVTISDGVGAIGDHAASAADALASGAKRLIPAQMMVDPLTTTLPVPTLQSHGGCTPTGWSGTYSVLSVKVGTVDVGPFRTTFDLRSDLQLAFAAAGVGNLNGVHANQEVAEIFCRPNVRPKFPNACDFWSPTALNSLCPALVMGNVAHGLGRAADRFRNLFGGN